MKYNFLFIGIILLLSTFTACNDDEADSYTVDHARLSSGEDYELLIGFYDENTVCYIKNQAEHFAVSQIDFVEENGRVYYRYQSLPDYIGEDQVKFYFDNMLIAPDGGTLLENDYTINFSISE